MMSVASLPMYARPETAKGYAAFWALIRAELREAGSDAPEKLSEDGIGYEFWRHPALVLSQTCGYPYRAVLKDDVALVGTPDYALKDTPPGYYRSVFVTHRDSSTQSLADIDNAAFAYNDDQSQSGYHGPLAYAKSQGITLRKDLITGGHRMSALAVSEGRAEVAALDIVTWLDCLRYDRDMTSKLRVIAQTPPVPGLPFVCAKSVDPAIVLDALHRALRNLSPEYKEQIRIQQIIPTTPWDYVSARFAVASGPVTQTKALNTGG